jgi:hypothetical protein
VGVLHFPHFVVCATVWVCDAVCVGVCTNWRWALSQYEESIHSTVVSSSFHSIRIHPFLTTTAIKV